jgi:hypothetical protein
MGGIGTLPMDYGQPLQVPQQQQPSFSSAQNITMNPLLNYGQPQLGGSTPLTMAGGGMSRLGYQEGGMGMEMMQPQMQDPMMQEQMMQQAPQIDPSQMDPKQALEIIIQMLIAQGIPPEQAREIAIQMVQAVAEGGMGEMSDERVEARFGGRIGYASGGIGSLVDREGYFLGSVFKGISKAVSGAVKGVTKAVKSIVKSDLGKAALAAAAIYATGGGALFGGPGFGSAGTLFGAGGALGSGGATSNFLFGSPVGGFGLEAASTPGLFGVGGQFAPMSGNLFGSNSILSGLTSGFTGGGGILSSLGGNALGSVAGGFLGGALGGALGGMPEQQPGESDEDYKRRVAEYRQQYEQSLNNPNPKFAPGQYPNNPFYPQRAANGGRIGYQEGGIGDLVKQVTQQEFFGTPMMANGGRMQYAMGAEVPTRQNEVGVTELDYRKKGGFVPPIGIKEKADDIPAMLSNNEFVFTADAVRNAGNGSVNKGAERMYGLMKKLEAGGIV